VAVELGRLALAVEMLTCCGRLLLLGLDKLAGRMSEAERRVVSEGSSRRMADLELAERVVACLVLNSEDIDIVVGTPEDRLVAACCCKGRELHEVSLGLAYQDTEA
jgi:hypothetical protein